ncbi:uncharacterized protein [Clytia hemisphaerica]|uniref:Uncharacterized protein n=1 Tax=Clytia hemisphaerica TaxID=252671 RepID=A0A7M5VB52_9CNID
MPNFLGCCKSSVAPDISLNPAPNPLFLGEFENRAKDAHGAKDNKWNYVTITYDRTKGVYTWKNKAGKSWTLYPSDQIDELTVGTDCDYYACAQGGPGHWIAKFTFSGVYGPGDEMYHRKDVTPLYTGDFVCQIYEVKNDYHYVTIVEDPVHTNYKWMNRAGCQWSLTPKGIDHQMAVGEECVYYQDGHHNVKYTAKGVHGPGNELYFRKCGSPLLVGEYQNHFYDQIGKNDTHYVTITYNIHDDSYTWTNRAGEEWTLYPTENFNVLKVGEDCPAFKKGYEVTEFCRTGIFGPGMEFFAKSECKPWNIGKFVHEKTTVHISYDTSVHRYKVKVGKEVGFVDITNDFRILNIDKGCPLFVEGKNKLRISHKGIDYDGKLYKRIL